MLRKTAWIIFALVIGGYLVNSYLDGKARRDAKIAHARKIDKETRLAVSEMINRWNAFDDWESQLSKGEMFRSNPILTIELEKLWVQNRPIYFTGAIKDIDTHDQSNYTILVERKFLTNPNYIFHTTLQLLLQASKRKIDSFLEENPELFDNYGFNNNVAVIANIRSIQSTYVTEKEYNRKDVKIGEGDLIDIIFLRNMIISATE